MDNIWGSQLMLPISKAPSRSFHELDELVRSTVPKHRALKVTDSGTSANRLAIDMVTGGDHSTTLFAAGTCVGGDCVLQPHSTSRGDNSKNIAIPCRPDQFDVALRDQIVGLPYHVPILTDADSSQLLKREHDSLVALHHKLLTAALSGKPHKGLLLECILGGNGGQLSKRFLYKLGSLVSAFHVKVIADEVLTGGRVGPTMTMTSNMPESFKKSVPCITMGKLFGCGLVLEHIDTNPLQGIDGLRGTTTKIDPKLAHAAWKTVNARLASGMVNKRQQEVLKALRLVDKPNSWWGEGCLIFGELARPKVLQGLKQRYLPLLERGMKLHKGNCKKTDVNRCTLDAALHEIMTEWQQESVAMDIQKAPFLCAMIDHIAKTKPLAACVSFTVEDVLKNIDQNRLQELAELSHQLEIAERIGCRPRCSKKPKAHLHKAVSVASTSNALTSLTAGERPFVQKRMGKKRASCMIVNKTLLGYDVIV